MGVKSLWQLLAPVGRPVQLENMEGKTMAIDSSIWIYQFQATMRDKEGRVLVNAHVLGFLRRITKLLFYGIKPVFVFDGGAPALKRNTLNQRRERKTDATESHTRIAERLLAAQLRQAAVQQAQSSSSKKGKGKAPAEDEDVVYLEDIDPTMQKTPARKPAQPSTPPTSQSQTQASASKAKFRDHDIYKLPEVNLEAAIAKASATALPDPRLATEDELRTFIDEMRPEDLDVTSPAFRELPTEVQYEIVGDLRLKSRQTSYVRLQNMLSASKTPLDFSKQQIANLQRRNALTQQLLVTTDTIGSAHISIPVRVASERNKQYVLVKNSSAEGGWVLGIRDTTGNSAEKPIEIDKDEDVKPQVTSQSQVIAPPVAVDSDSDDEDMEEVQIDATYTPSIPMDSDLRAYHAENALSAIERRQRETAARGKGKGKAAANGNERLFTLDGDDFEDEQLNLMEEDDDLLAIAIQESLEQPAVEVSSPSKAGPEKPNRPSISETPSRLETALAIGIGGYSTPVPHASPLPSPSPIRTFGVNAPRLPSPSPVRTFEESVEDTVKMPAERSLEEPTAPFPEPSRLIRRSPVVDADHSNHSTDTLMASGSRKTMDEDEDLVNDQDEDQGGPAEEQPEQPHDDFDAAHEMDATAEEGEFARFLSQVKGRDLASVRSEIDDEITSLRQQRTAAMRAAEDVTQQMVAQIMIMLRLFGIPYMTAPMEAEAQCATLVSLNLVDGVITDDSDVFLFGAARVFKNMFNQSKTVECFLAADLQRELGLDRGVLIRLAYLLGSDYTEGLPGVGPVMAMELLREFPGDDGLERFREWWGRVQMGRDGEESNTAFRRRFTKKFKDLYLPPDWPNGAVRDAYLHPTVDESEEPFKWGLPDLDGLREFFNGELGWSQYKVDELLLPIISKMGKRGQTQTNKQGTLNSFLDVSLGTGTHAPRKRQAYASKRLQQVVSDFRKKRAGLAEDNEEEAENGEPVRKRRRTVVPKGKGKGTQRKGKGNQASVEGDDDLGEGVGESVEGNEDGGAQDAEPAKAPRKRVTAKKPAAKKASARKARKKRTASEEEEEDDDNSDDNYAGDGGDDAPFSPGDATPPPRRPRPKPRPVRRSTANTEAS
ncbi:PIN domain-like protein [Schizophyllum commune Loenen D]|nr:PIN domain-like protein [Schizophyllum commune Loenen D]